ncbi:MAG TPA: ABC transporter permease [Acidimicrobiia bacterium]|nr:ABC transporter permease [Acidimicrobiia bacterium]
MYIARRIGIFALSVLISSLLVFVVLSILPGDPAQAMLGTQATPEAVEALRDELGLNRPILVQYVDWLASAVRGDLGTSPFSGQDIAAQIGQRLQLTIPLALLAMAMTIIIAFPLGVFAAARHRKLGDAVISVGSQVGLAIPAFWAGLLMVTVFAVNLGWFSASGFPGWKVSVADSIRALFLPALSLAIVQAAIITRYVRSAVLDTMRHDYIRSARSKGLTWSAALWRHGLRNAAIPVLTVLGLQFAALLAGTVVIESVFVLPGLGSMLLQGITRRDLPLVQGGALTIAVLILTVNLAVDLLYRFIDPRVARR